MGEEFSHTWSGLHTSPGSWSILSVTVCGCDDWSIVGNAIPGRVARRLEYYLLRIHRRERHRVSPTRRGSRAFSSVAVRDALAWTEVAPVNGSLHQGIDRPLDRRGGGLSNCLEGLPSFDHPRWRAITSTVASAALTAFSAASGPNAMPSTAMTSTSVMPMNPRTALKYVSWKLNACIGPWV